MKTIKLEGIIPASSKNQRLDLALAKLFPEYSRENLKQWILNGNCYVNNNNQLSPKTKVQSEEIIIIEANLIDNNKNHNWHAQNLPLDIIYEDQDLLIINKANNIIMHPGAGNWDKTILNALLYYNSELSLLPRAGIVHRLDQNTTGLVIIAKNLLAYNNLIKQLKKHKITKIYEALVFGNLITGDTIDAPIGRDPKNRLKMAVLAYSDKAKPAITHYRILKKFNNYTYIKIQIETGRTHQIRVHMKYINHPIVGDQLYAKQYINLSNNLNFKRQALHAKELYFKHPRTNQELQFIAPLPLDLQELLTKV